MIGDIDIEVEKFKTRLRTGQMRFWLTANNETRLVYMVIQPEMYRKMCDTYGNPDEQK